MNKTREEKKKLQQRLEGVFNVQAVFFTQSNIKSHGRGAFVFSFAAFCLSSRSGRSERGVLSQTILDAKGGGTANADACQ